MTFEVGAKILNKMQQIWWKDILSFSLNKQSNYILKQTDLQEYPKLLSQWKAQKAKMYTALHSSVVQNDEPQEWWVGGWISGVSMVLSEPHCY
jgi:hypothetical protein